MEKIKQLDIIKQLDDSGDVCLLAVNEVFNSLQGEGSLVGMPCTFIRTNICFNKCSFCDTSYTWKNIVKNKMFSEIDLLDMLESRYARKNIVITGGEPFEQKFLTEFIYVLITAGYNIFIETSGSVGIDKSLIHLMEHKNNIKITLSPKKRIHESFYKVPILDLKLLVDINTNLDELFFQYKNFNLKLIENILLQPVEVLGNKSETDWNIKRCLKLLDEAVNVKCRGYEKYKLSYQLHKILNLK